MSCAADKMTEVWMEELTHTSFESGSIQRKGHRYSYWVRACLVVVCSSLLMTRRKEILVRFLVITNKR